MSGNKYRKKPVVIEAVQLQRSNVQTVCRFMGEEIKTDTWQDQDRLDEHRNIIESDGLKITTLEGEMTAQIGDYIIKGIQGEFYPCKPDIFEATYEKVEQEGTTSKDHLINYCARCGHRVAESVIGSLGNGGDWVCDECGCYVDCYVLRKSDYKPNLATNLATREVKG